MNIPQGGGKWQFRICQTTEGILFDKFLEWQTKSRKERRGKQIPGLELRCQPQASPLAAINLGSGAFRVDDPVFLNAEARVEFEFRGPIDSRGTRRQNFDDQVGSALNIFFSQH